MARPTKERRRRRKAGDLVALKRELWHAVMTAGDLLDDEDANMRLRAVHAVAQAAATYRSLIEALEFEERLKQLEEANGVIHLRAA